MDSRPLSAPDMPPDVWQLIFDQLAGDYASLCNVSLTCHAWRSLSEPSLYKIVDISSHNDGRLPQYEKPDVLPVVYAEYSASYRSRNLFSRQIDFSQTITARPALAVYVKTLIWTLIWPEKSFRMPHNENWPVFALMKNVTRLDLASLYQLDDDGNYAQKTPPGLFPNVVDLRLVGVMYRGIVKAIITSINAKNLRSLALDYVQDEGAMADGSPMSEGVAYEYAHHAQRSPISSAVNEELFRRQETGRACVFPGPMWYPLKLLSSHSMESLTQLQVKVAPFSMHIDLRNYYTMFEQTANLMLKARQTLSTITIVLAEDRDLYEETRYRSTCGTSNGFLQNTYRPWCIRVAAAFLDTLFAVLSKQSFPLLTRVRFEGFHFLEVVSSEEAAAARLDRTFESIRACSMQNASFTDISCVDYREAFPGFSYQVEDHREMQAILEDS